MGLCEMRWKHFSEMSTDDGRNVYFNGEEDYHKYGAGFLVHKDIASPDLGCRTVSSRLVSIRLGAAPLNIPSYMFMREHLVTMTMRSTTSTSNSKKP